MPGSNNQRHCSPVQTSLTPVNPWSDRTYVRHASVQDKDSLEWSSNAPKSKCPVQITSDIVPCPSITNLWPLNSPTNENVCMLLKFVREQSHLAYASIKSYRNSYSRRSSITHVANQPTHGSMTMLRVPQSATIQTSMLVRLLPCSSDSISPIMSVPIQVETNLRQPKDILSSIHSSA